jgi:DNA-binding XRE family transcriptional regulator
MPRHRFPPRSPEEKIEWRLAEHRIREHTKHDSGAYDPPLPDPAERRRIREAAGLTQQDVAAELGVHQSLISFWKKAGPLGYNERGERLPKCEPSGERRRQYAALLKMVKGRKTGFYDA